MTLFAGPQIQSELKKMAPGLELVVDYGWLTVIAAPIFWGLEAIHGVIGNWGWAIVILTVLIKLSSLIVRRVAWAGCACCQTGVLVGDGIAAAGDCFARWPAVARRNLAQRKSSAAWGD